MYNYVWNVQKARMQNRTDWSDFSNDPWRLSLQKEANFTQEQAINCRFDFLIVKIPRNAKQASK